MTRRKIAILVALSAAVAAAGGTLAGRWNSPKQVSAEEHQAASTPAAGPLRVVLGERSAICHELGDMPRSGRREVPFVVSNRGPAAVTVGTIRASCDCLRVELDATQVEAGAEVGGRAVIDLASESGFTGGLMLDAEASAKEDGRTVFVLKLSVQVR